MQMLVMRFPAVLLLTLGCTLNAFAQVQQIDRAKLPQDLSVQSAYTDLLPIDEYARNYAQRWPYPVPKEQVVLRFTRDLQALETAQRSTPSNGELRLLTGLVAHLTYNLDVESAYTPALSLLQSAESEAGQDFRPAWFLAMHQCESNDPVGGMKHLLQDEGAHENLPAPFWRDYMLCAQVAFMPAHALRAYDTMTKLGNVTSEDTGVAQANRQRFTLSSTVATYPKRVAWEAEAAGDRVRFTSTVCGESFLVKPTSEIDIMDVTRGTCVVTITPGKYSTRHGESSPSLLVFTQVAKPGQTLDAFLHGLLANPKYASAKPIEGITCPVAKCLAYEILTDKLYSKEGGAHLLAVAFASEQPAYPGLRFEIPRPLPKTGGDSNSPQFLRPNNTQQRFDGTIYTFLALDANEDIYVPSRADFDALVQSMVIDSK